MRWAVAIGLIAAGIGVAWAFDRYDVALVDPEALSTQVRATGAFAPAALIALLVVQSVIAPLPSQPVLMAAGFVYGPIAGLAIGWLGVFVGACACFGIARVLGRAAAVRFVSPERLESVDAYVSERGLRSTFLAVMSLRLVAHFSFDVTSYACGVVRFPFGWFALATALGEIPKVLLFTTLGAGLGEISGWLGVGIGVGVMASVCVFMLMNRRASRAA